MVKFNFDIDDQRVEEEGLTTKKLIIYVICAAVGLAIGFALVYFRQ